MKQYEKNISKYSAIAESAKKARAMKKKQLQEVQNDTRIKPPSVAG